MIISNNVFPGGIAGILNTRLCSALAIHGIWFLAIPAGMTILNGAFIEYDKVELS
ncbi:hypothetical protein [Methylicorpusculum sp.]|uniref:hypothetical protein n=1 Tax=Methylicorpusculum sp. TaxID=2713644 RepID=UPI002729BE34|nr:hypothetical protein [Methylicorpusculum sp.]